MVLVCSSMEAGGAERVLSGLANEWVVAGHSVTVVSIYSREQGHDFFALDPRITRIRVVEQLNVNGKTSAGRWARFTALRRILEESRPDVIVAFMDKIAVTTLAAAWGLGFPVVACERTDPLRHVIGPGWRWLRRYFYPRAAAVTVQTEDVKRTFGEVIPRMNLWVMPNAIPAPLARRPALKDVKSVIKPRVMAIGRLGREKGFDLLIDAFSRVARRYPAWELWVWGEGKERRNLEAQMTSLGLEGRVFLPGLSDTPWEEMERSEIVVVPSRYEGMPNAMLEAMALGRAVVASDCASGPREVSNDGRCAVLVPPDDVAALAPALDRLMGDEKERQRIGRLALSVRERYSMDRVLALWEELFMQIETVRRAKLGVR